MSNRSLLAMFTVLASVSIPVSLLVQATSVQAQAPTVQASETCIAFRPMGSSSYEVRKTVSSTGVTPGVRNNWDTDFIVPPGTRFTRYIATITSETPETYNIIVNFKFANQTARQVFRRDGVRLVGGVPFQIIGDPPAGSNQPVQINLNVSGRQGATYRLSVSGCSRQ